MSLGVKHLVPPQPFGHINTNPQKLIAAAVKFPSGGFFHQKRVLFWGRGKKKLILIQKHHAADPRICVPGLPAHQSQVNTVSIGKLHQIGHSGPGRRLWDLHDDPSAKAVDPAGIAEKRLHGIHEEHHVVILKAVGLGLLGNSGALQQSRPDMLLLLRFF